MAAAKISARTKKFGQDLRKFALGYPDTREDHPWGHSAFKVNGKVFVFMDESEAGLSLSIKLKLSHLAALELPFTEPTHYGMGKHGWVTARFGPAEAVPVGLLTSWIDESFGLIAPKRLLKAMDAGELKGKPAKKTKAKPAKAKSTAKKTKAKPAAKKTKAKARAASARPKT